MSDEKPMGQVIQIDEAHGSQSHNLSMGRKSGSRSKRSMGPKPNPAHLGGMPPNEPA